MACATPSSRTNNGCSWRDGKLTQYETDDHRISGISQQASTRQEIAFTSQNGAVRLDELKKLD
jgi:hypothetical protein